MEVLGCCKCVGVVILMGVWRLSFISAQPGFLSIDCGAETNRTDPETNITWVTDDNYLIGSAGVKQNINDSTSPFYLQSARVFPMPINKSCYELPLTPDVPHLLRVWINAGTLNGLQRIPRFYISIETVDMLHMGQIRFDEQQLPHRGERVLVSSGEVLYICLIRNSDDDYLFISAIELRTLQKGMYDMAKPGQLLRMLGRYDMGAQSTTRYPQDRFDRLWLPFSIGGGAKNVSFMEPISTINTRNLPPSAVMQTAAVTNNHSMYFPLQLSPFPQIANYFLLLLYFAEIEQTNGSESRNFDVLINNEISLANISLQRDFSAREVALKSEIPQLSLMLQRNPGSTLGPIINAFERYQMLLTEPATSSMDAQALAAMKQRFNIKNWISDPCFVVPWEGIECTTISSTVRVSKINLSGRNLTGSIPPAVRQLTELVHISLENNHLTGALPNLSSLTKLEGLYLQNNSLSGRVPDWLSQLHNLKELFIENNNFSGVIPQQLLSQPSLEIRYGGNFYLCMNKGECLRSSQSKGNRVSVIIGAIASGFAIICVAFIVCTVRRRKKKFKRATAGRFPDYSMIMVPNTSKSRAFSLDEMKFSTENFSHNIGQGGFGSVFWGKLRDEKQIAVKVLSLFSKQGVSQFLNEIDLLSRVHHKNLVSLLGYCNESRDLMLVYEYMPGGSLNNHLYGSNPLKYPELDWKSRLKIALDAAQGLEYLHIGSTPKIIHRDVKSANILLDNNLNGKLADFGLSRVAMDEEASHVSTGVRGTAGYLDPKYFSTHMLTDKSDVYSFGVVLLEIICGRRPVDFKQSEDKVDLIKWVTPYAKQFVDFVEILEIVDKRLVTNYNMKSISKIAKLAMRCIAEEPSYRPTVSEVVMEIKEAINYENDNNSTTFIDVSEEISIKYANSDSRYVSTTESNEHSSETSSVTSSVKQLESTAHHHDHEGRD